MTIRNFDPGWPPRDPIRNDHVAQTFDKKVSDTTNFYSSLQTHNET